MKTTTRISRNNIDLLEPGDRLRFRAGEDHRDDWRGPHEFEVTVRGTLPHSLHGPRIVTQEPIEDGEGGTQDDFYLVDDWIVDLIQDVRGSAAEELDRAILERLLDEHFPRIEPREQRSPNIRGDDPTTDLRDDERAAIDEFIDVVIDAGFQRPPAQIIQDLLAEGLSVRAVAARSGLSRSSVHRISQSLNRDQTTSRSATRETGK